MRNHLISLDAENERNLLEIQKSICIIVLENRRPETEAEVFRSHFLHGLLLP